MSATGARRPAANGTHRMPRGDRAADQMALNGALLHRDNSDASYKRILARLSGTGSYGVAKERMRALSFEERRDLLCSATLVWCAQELVSSLGRWTVLPGLAPLEMPRTLLRIGRRLAVVLGKRHGERGIRAALPSAGRGSREGV